MAAFLDFEWASEVTGIRDRFQLKRENIQSIDRYHGIRGIEQVIVIRFLVDTKARSHRHYAAQVKPSEVLKDIRTIEKLEKE